MALTATFKSAIPVCTVKYSRSSGMTPVVLRMRDVKSDSFFVRLQSANLYSLWHKSSRYVDIGTRDVHCVIMEQGSWMMPDGRLVEARKYETSKTSKSGSKFVGQKQNYRNEYKHPVVLGQVMTSNNDQWSVFWSRGRTRGRSANSRFLYTGKQTGGIPPRQARQKYYKQLNSKNPEEIGYIVMESGSHLNLSSNYWNEFTRVEAWPRGRYGSYINRRGGSARFVQTWEKPPAVTVASQASMADRDGSWAVLTTEPTTRGFGVAVDEDQYRDMDRRHGKEAIHFVAFSEEGLIQLIDADFADYINNF